MIKFNKGDRVWSIGSWDNKGTFSYQLLTIESWGKKNGTATKVVDGMFRKQRIYTESANRDITGIHFFPESIDPVAKALELARRYITEYLEPSFARCLSQNTANENYLAHTRKEQAEVHEPRALPR